MTVTKPFVSRPQSRLSSITNVRYVRYKVGRRSLQKFVMTITKSIVSPYKAYTWSLQKFVMVIANSMVAHYKPVLRS